MRLIDLKCRNCGVVFEELVRRDEDVATVACPDCGAQEAERQLSAAAFIGGGGGRSTGGGGCAPGGRFT
jgi:putative FmdB family regulatory protein